MGVLRGFAVFFLLGVALSARAEDSDCRSFLEGAPSTVQAWMELKRPFLGKRARGLRALRDAGRRGVTWVAPADSALLEKSKTLPSALQKEMEYLAGAPVLWIHEGRKTPDEPDALAGLALHPGMSARLLNFARGEINPHLGYGRLHARLDAAGGLELARHYAPAMVARPNERLLLAKNAARHPLVYRVDFLDGEAVRFSHLHSAETATDAGYGAAAFLNRFFETTPAPFKYLAGSADIATLRDGSLKIVAFAFGGESLSIDPFGPTPVLAAEFLAALTPLPHPLLEDLDQAAREDVALQAAMLARLMRISGDVPYQPDHTAWPELAWVDGYRRIRDQRVLAWRKHGARSTELPELERDLARLASQFPGTHPEALDRLHALYMDWKPAARAEARR